MAHALAINDDLPPLYWEYFSLRNLMDDILGHFWATTFIMAQNSLLRNIMESIAINGET